LPHALPPVVREVALDLDLVRRCAETSVQRGLGFSLLAVGCLMLSCSFNVSLAFEVGAGCFLLLCTILFFRALEAPTRDYRKTETWILLKRPANLPPERLQKTIGSILQELYRRYAEWMLAAAVALWLGSVISRIL
jgi:hypothetical protein